MSKTIEQLEAENAELRRVKDEQWHQMTDTILDLTTQLNEERDRGLVLRGMLEAPDKPTDPARFVFIHGQRVEFEAGDWPLIGAHVRAKLPEWSLMDRCIYLDDSAPGSGGISYESLRKPIADADVIPWGSKVVTLPHATA